MNEERKPSMRKWLELGAIASIVVPLSVLSIGIAIKSFYEPKREIEQVKGVDNKIDLEQITNYFFKLSLRRNESEENIGALNKYSGAAGPYQYLPSTALGLITQAAREGIEIPYNSPTNTYHVSEALRTNSELNEALIDYDISKRKEKFGNNIGLLAMAHYTNERDLLRSLKIVYPEKTDYNDANIEEFANARAKGLVFKNGEFIRKGNKNNWLIRKQTNNYPSILDYSTNILKETGGYVSHFMSLNNN